MGCRAVLRYMFDAAKQEDEKVGNRECQPILKKEWSDLPICRNDHEFEFVASACGYGGHDFMSSPVAGRSNRFYRLSNQEQNHVCYTSMSKNVV